MATNENAINLIVAQEAVQQLNVAIGLVDVLDKLILKTANDAVAVSAKLAGIKTPSGVGANASDNAQLNATLEAQAKQIANLEASIKRLTDAKIKLNQTSVQEQVNQRVLLQNATLEAKAVSSMAGAYVNLDAQHKKALKSAQDIGAQFGINSEQFKKAQASANAFDRQLKDIDASLGRSQRNVGNYSSAFGGLKTLFSSLGFVGGVAGLVAVGKEIFNTTKEIQSLDLALKSVTETQENFKEQQAFLSRIANKYGLEIKDLTKQYVSFYVSAKNKLAGSEIQELFENISKSGSALGLSNETLGRSFTALNQMLSKGTVASEELRGQLAESLPGAVQAMTKAVQILHPEIKNLTEKGLFEMIKAGKILASEVLPETARQLVLITGADKAEGIETITKEVNKLSNSWAKMIVSINESDTSGFAKFVKTIIAGLTNIMDFTGLLFKDEKQLQNYFKDLGKGQGLEEFNAIMKNISTVSKEQQESTKKALLERERENIRVAQAIIQAEKKKRESIMGGDRALFHLQTKQEEDALVQLGKSAEIIKKLKQGAGVVTPTGAPAPATVQEIAQPRKVKLDDSAYQLEKQRLELAIATNDAIAKDAEKTDAERLLAVDARSKKELDLITLNKNREFAKNKEVYDNAVLYAKQKMDADLSSAKITEEGKAKVRNQFKNDVASAKDELLNANEKTQINEKYAYDKVQIEKKASDEIKKINEFDIAEYEKALKRKVTAVEIENNDLILAEEKRFQAEIDAGYKNDKEKQKQAQAHEKALFEIKKKGIMQTTQLQIDSLQSELDAYIKFANADGVITQKESDMILKIRKDLSDATVALYKADNSSFKESEKGKTKEVEIGAKEILQWSEKLLGDLSDLSNAFTERRIQGLEAQIEASNEYYQNQIDQETTGEKKKKELEAERVKREKELQKQINKEKEKQAKIDKAVTIAQIAIQTALAVMKGFSESGWVGAVLAGVLGAIQLATAIATPIPKYKDGRMGGKDEFAWVGDGGRAEVITDAHGNNPVLTPSTPTVTHLKRGDIVHKSMEDYSVFKVAKSKELEIFGQYGDNNALLYEMQATRKAIEKQKLNVNVHNKPVDINYALWRNNQIHWQ